jgi:hypothetical protein
MKNCEPVAEESVHKISHSDSESVSLQISRQQSPEQRQITSRLHPEDGGSMHLWNVGIPLQHYTTSQPIKSLIWNHRRESLKKCSEKLINITDTYWYTSRPRWEDNIKMDLKDIGINGDNWIRLVQDRGQCRAFVNTVMNLRIP